jgi:hypothetical protein
LLSLFESGESMRTRTVFFATLASLSLVLVACGGSSDSAPEMATTSTMVYSKNAALATNTSRPQRPTMTTGPARTDGTNCRTQDTPFIDPKTKAIYCLGAGTWQSEYFAKATCATNQTYVAAYNGPGKPTGYSGCLDNSTLSAYLDKKK